MECATPSARLLACAPVALALLLLSGCAPFIADQQSARLLPEGGVEVTPSFSYVSFSVEGETEHVQDHYGVRLGYGATDVLELRAMFEHVSVEGVDEGVNLLGAGVKWALVPNQLAFYLPLGFATGGDIDTGDSGTVVPTLLGTYRTGATFEVTPSVKGIYPFTAENPELFLGFHLGAGISTDLDVWAFRPEVGAVVNPGDEGVTWGWTVGFTVRP